MKPILFNTPMVQAIMEGRKTATRRVIKPQYPEYQDGEPGCFSKIVPYGSSSFLATHKEHPNMKTVLKAPYRHGDILYVRETWAEWTGGYVYKADGANSPCPLSFVDRWHPSIHMPKEAARIFLRVTDVRAERLQDITDHGARQEGCGAPDVIYYSGALECEFADLWRKTVKPEEWPTYGWGANPWVWVILFDRCEKPDESGS